MERAAGRDGGTVVVHDLHPSILIYLLFAQYLFFILIQYVIIESDFMDGIYVPAALETKMYDAIAMARRRAT